MSSVGETRPRVIEPAMLGVVALAVGAVLALLFPGLDFGQSSHLARPDELSIAYLEQVLRTHADDRPARLLLARQQMALGHWDAAQASLGFLVDATDRVGWQARLALVELDRARLEALAPGDPSHADRQRQSLAAIRMLIAAPLRPDELAHLADLALALAAPETAAELYERLASTDVAHRHDWLSRAGKWRRATGSLGVSAELYLAASAAAPTERQGKEDVASAISVLIAANRGADALTAAETAAARWPDDAPLLDRVVTLSLAQKDGGLALRSSERLIALAPADEAALRRHLDIELGLGDTAAAFSTVSTLVARHPQDAALRRRLAEIATWSGHPREALHAWAWLSARGSEEASQRTLTLGHDLFDYARIAEVLRRRAEAGTITLQELLELSDALESVGAPEQARAVLRQFEPSFSGSPAYWHERAEVDEHLEDLGDALAAVREAGVRTGASPEDAQREVELLWSLQRPDEALASARRAARLVPADAAGFWRIYAELAWTREDDVAAETAYRQLWTTDKADASVADRLVTLLEGHNDMNGVIEVGSEGFARFGTPSLLVAAVEAADAGERWDETRRLLALAHRRGGEALFTDQAGVQAASQTGVQTVLWSATGRLAAHDGRPREAAAAFAKVVARTPGDANAREDLLWARVDAGLERAPDDDDGDDTLSPGGDKARVVTPPDSGTRLAMAIEKHDRRAVRAVLAEEDSALTVSERVDAARELGDDERAWELLAHAPESTGNPEEDVALAEQRRELAEERLSGVWTSGGAQSLGALGIIEETVKTTLRKGAYGIEVLAEHARLDANAGPIVSGVHADEWRAGAALRLQEPWGDSRVEVGGLALPTGGLAYLSALQRFSVTDRLQLELEGHYHALPSDSAALRIAGLRDVVEGELKWEAGQGFALSAMAGGSRYTDRDGDPLATGWLASAEVSRVMRASNLFARVRADGFAERNALVATLPPRLTDLVRAGVSAGNLLPESYATTGVGVTIYWRDDDDEVASGKGCLRCFRPFTDLWGGWLMPAQRLTYNVDAGLGFLFARHQEVAARGFYYSDFAGEPGQHYGGASLSYTLRWL
jgi:hypothetical protein